jgi:hypothetical protein
MVISGPASKKGWGGSKGYSSIADLEAKREGRVKERETEARGLLDQIIQLFQPGGGFGQGAEAMLARQKQRYMAGAQQGLVQSGLFGTTLTAGLGKKFEEEVGMPARMRLEDLRFSQLAEAMSGKAGFIERISEQPLDYRLAAELVRQGGGSGARPIGFGK